MEDLLQICNETEKQLLIKAQNELIQFYFDTLKTANSLRLKEENISYPDVIIAKNAVRTINELCADKEISPVFKGDATNVEDIFQLAVSIVENISKKIDADIKPKS